MFDPLSTTPGSPQTTFEPFSDPSLPSTVNTEPSQAKLRETVAKLPTQTPPVRWSTISRRPQDLPDDLQEFQHVGLGFRPPPTILPPPRLSPFRSFRAKFREFRERLGLRRAHRDHY